MVSKFRTPIHQRQGDALLPVPREDQPVPALVGVDPPSAVVGLIMLRLQNDGYVLLNLSLDDTKPPEMRFAQGKLEEFVPVSDRDVAGLPSIGIDRGTITPPQIPFRGDALFVQGGRAASCQLPLRRCYVLEIVLRAVDLSVVRASNVVPVFLALRPLRLLLRAQFYHTHINARQIPKTTVHVYG